jgi:hypothetical protein
MGKKNKSIDLELAKVEQVLQNLTGLSLDDILEQACALDEQAYSEYELRNILKMNKYLEGDKNNVH